jgi:Zn-dependent protease with chaperone function
MIPSSPGRIWLFLGASLALFVAPDILAPAAWHRSPDYPFYITLYFSGVLLLGFLLGPAICQAMVLQEIGDGPARRLIDAVLAGLETHGRRLPRVVLAKHALPFILTAGMYPAQSRIFVSNAYIARLAHVGVRFLLARAVAHASWRQRLATVAPLLALTVVLPNTPEKTSDWFALLAFLGLWLPWHWAFELDADRQAARLTGQEALLGLRACAANGQSPTAWVSFHPPLAWRERVVQGALEQAPKQQ